MKIVQQPTLIPDLNKTISKEIISKVNFDDNKNILNTYYKEEGLLMYFEKDIAYLEKAFYDILQLWQHNFDQIEIVNYLMIAEAPLWGQIKKYIYNPDTKNTQFFHRNDLSDILNIKIKNKSDFIKVCNEIGLLFVDISPFPLNPVDTSINYRELTKKEYRQIISLTVPTYFEKIIKIVKEKKSRDIKTIFRYVKIRNTFQDIVAEILINNGFINDINEIGDISQKGGGIDRTKFKRIVNYE